MGDAGMDVLSDAGSTPAWSIQNTASAALTEAGAVINLSGDILYKS